jgi:uncharacterized protein YigA (DUF484 family)
MSEEFPTEIESQARAGFPMDAFIPLVFLSASFITLLGWQLKMGATQKNLMENAITRQEPAVNQSQQVQASVTKLVTDLLQAAQTDDAAKAIVTKYKIQQAAPAGSPAP